MPKVKNVFGRDVIVGWRLVAAGQEIEVPDADRQSFVQDARHWAEVKHHAPKKSGKPADDSQEG
jgi:hypothetical protein